MKNYINLREGNGCKVSDLERDLKDLNFNKLSLDEQLSLEGEINVNEASKVLQKVNNNKSPGIDLKSFVVNSINFGSLLGELSVTARYSEGPLLRRFISPKVH